MRIAIAILTGFILATLLSVGLVQANAASKVQTDKPLYNYGSK